ncbi:MAG: hypothetical protein SPJ83_07655 [Helicobacter sp.]|nr:hypothetical protein [Helicobacter sp.]MDY5822641.1 hypothetical protein [Helicobacter sp.]
MRNVGCKKNFKGVTLKGNDRRNFSPLPHLSQKAELPSQRYKRNQFS